MKETLGQLFFAVTLLTVFETSLMTLVTLEIKNPPRFHSSIVSSIQGSIDDKH
ncbi:hypothetical protein ACOI1C_17870 [Bacillus sp. DJP31]|uniref:hypothetical protein n=1 Tax=Bacillus sp. DJP31 TaxID=3409789 RepID=UPI003BB4F3AB